MLDDIALAATEVRSLPGHLDGHPFTALLRDDDEQREAALSRLLSELARPDVRVVRMGNSMRSRLMLEHILIQVAGPDGRMSQEDATRRIARTIAERQGRETRVVLLITQAETLHSKTLRLLQAMQPYFLESGAPALQVVFVGRPAFRALLDGHGMAPLRDALGFRPQADAVRPATPDSMPVSGMAPRLLPAAQDPGQPATLADLAAASGAPAGQVSFSNSAPKLSLQPDAAGHAAMSVPAARRSRSLLLGLAVFAAMASAAFTGLYAAFHRPVQARAVPSVSRPAGPSVAVPPTPDPAVQDPQASTPAPTQASPVQAAPSGPGRSTLPTVRRGPDTPELSNPPFHEALPSAGPPSRVVVHVPAGSEGAEAMSAHLRAGLGSRSSAVEVRRVAGTPDRLSIRYFHPGDEPAAHQVAAWMADAGLIWTLQDFSTFLPRPSRGTIEVWLPRS